VIKISLIELSIIKKVMIVGAHYILLEISAPISGNIYNLCPWTT